MLEFEHRRIIKDIKWQNNFQHRARRFSEYFCLNISVTIYLSGEKKSKTGLICHCSVYSLILLCVQYHQKAINVTVNLCNKDPWVAVYVSTWPKNSRRATVAFTLTCLWYQARLTGPFHDPAQWWQLHTALWNHTIPELDKQRFLQETDPQDRPRLERDLALP